MCGEWNRSNIKLYNIIILYNSIIQVSWDCDIGNVLNVTNSQCHNVRFQICDTLTDFHTAEDLEFGNAMNFQYLCIVNEKRRNLRPNQVTKIAQRAGNCFLGKAQIELIRRQKKIFNNLLIKQFINH